MKYIDEQTQAQLLNMNEVILEVEKALQAFSENKTITPLRYVLPFNEQNRYLVMPALSDELNIVGLKQSHLHLKIQKKRKRLLLDRLF